MRRRANVVHNVAVMLTEELCFDLDFAAKSDC
jgi:hypothetical protein